MPNTLGLRLNPINPNTGWMIHTGCNIQGPHKQTNKQTKNTLVYIFSRDKSLLATWTAAVSAHNNSDSSSESSICSVTSTPSNSTAGNSSQSSIEALTKQVAALENELKDRNERLETATER